MRRSEERRRLQARQEAGLGADQAQAHVQARRRGGLDPCRFPCKDPVRRLMKRQLAVEMCKETAVYRYLADRAAQDPGVALPEEPVPSLELPKRQWEHIVGVWKEELSEVFACLQMRACGESYWLLPLADRRAAAPSEPGASGSPPVLRAGKGEA